MQSLIEGKHLQENVIKAIESIRNTTARERAMSEKIGFDLGIYAIHPLTQEKLPVWVANFVLMDYGSGAVMSVPMHDERDFEFAKTYSLPLKCVLVKDKDSKESTQEVCAAYEEGYLINSGEFSGMYNAQAKENIIAFFEKQGRGKRVRLFLWYIVNRVGLCLKILQISLLHCLLM